MITERDSRRPDLIPGSPIHLADGGDWTIPSPACLESFQDDSWFQTSYARAVLDLFEAQDAEERQAAELALAICLLSRNYTIEPSGYREILGAREPRVREELRHQIRDVAEAHAVTFGRREHDRVEAAHSRQHWFDSMLAASTPASSVSHHHP